MKRFLFLALVCGVCFFSASGQKKLNEIDLRIKGVGSGSAYSAVIGRLGKPIRTKSEKMKAEYACSGKAETHLTLFYPGLEITLLGDGNGRKSEIYALKVVSGNWAASGISLGAAEKTVRNRFGEPDSVEKKAGENVFQYVTKDNLGVVNFYFRNDQLKRIEMTETLC